MGRGGGEEINVYVVTCYKQFVPAPPQNNQTYNFASILSFVLSITMMG